ncbi:hypothetical protein MATL_G00217400 [Megalops atlanticus]|uniref:Globoside alpha-1,3-N-acetylgalactosaminyltransferase 1 n=1 Tax=Megalops atlanticus TaxID=7932 RepID=A0A9D3PIZ1_MEGAT|nr:hypothetical protein MATL_G00217400 [Megalops atlanticus]
MNKKGVKPPLRYFLLFVFVILLLGAARYFERLTVPMHRSFCPQSVVTTNVTRSASSINQNRPALPATPQEVLQLRRANYEQPRALIPPRNDVLTVTPWLAPIVWEGTFDPDMIDSMYKSSNITIATTVFAVGKYIQFLRDFLETAEKYYLSGLRVHYYVFTDQPQEVPRVELAVGRNISIIQVPKYSRWQEISLRRMEIIQRTIEERIHIEADYIFCMDVDMKFHSRWGPETLGTLVGVLHPWYYEFTRDQFTYERRPESAAYIPMEEGDFYYMAAVFGGSVKEVHALTKKCHEHLEVDKSKDLEAIWQEESHLNWYLLYNKPTKVLSPEYLWDDQKGGLPKDIKVKRFSAVIKNKWEVRDNV